jgi:PadR family transcriptional regulator PadR
LWRPDPFPWGGGPRGPPPGGMASQYILCNKTYGATMTVMTADDTAPGDDRRGIDRELKRGSLELIVLHLLAPGEAYGYEIVSKLTAETNGALEITDGTLYPVLYRLERGGFVSVRWETPERGVPRKYYRLTDAGRAELERLKYEWTTFARAMTKLLKQERGTK